MSDDVTKPRHYLSHPSGIECIQIAEHMNFCLGNAIKYIWRAGLKTEDPVKDLRKAVWYLNREIERISGGNPEEIERVRSIFDFKYVTKEGE